jgi:hypothetical protein
MEMNFLDDLRPLPDRRMQSCNRKVRVITAAAASGWDRDAVRSWMMKTGVDSTGYGGLRRRDEVSLGVSQRKVQDGQNSSTSEQGEGSTLKLHGGSSRDIWASTNLEQGQASVL